MNYLKKALSLIPLLGVLNIAAAQLQNPVRWEFTAKKINELNYEIHLTAHIENGWHIYSQSTPEGGPVPSSIQFQKNPLVSPQGPVKEMGKMEQHNEPLFGVDVKQYDGKVDFVQSIRLKAKVKTVVRGSIYFMSCNDRECLPPKSVPFSIAIN